MTPLTLRSPCVGIPSCAMSSYLTNSSHLRTSKLQFIAVVPQRQHFVSRSVLCFNRYDTSTCSCLSFSILCAEQQLALIAELEGAGWRRPCNVLQADRWVCNLAQLPVLHSPLKSCRCKQTMFKALCSSHLWQTRTGYVNSVLNNTAAGLAQNTVMSYGSVCLHLDLLSP